MLRLPREIRTIIYEHLSCLFKAYAGAFVTSDLQPVTGDVYMFDTGAWYSIRHFKGEQIYKTSILELEAAPWAHSNISHLFSRTPARHLMCMHPQLLDECIDGIRAFGYVVLSGNAWRGVVLACRPTPQAPAPNIFRLGAAEGSVFYIHTRSY